MSICQISIPCTDIEASEELYVAMLKPLRYKISIKTRDTVFFSGRFQFRPELCLRQEQSGGLTGGVRITIYASSKARVNKFYILGLSKSNTIQRGTTDDYPNAYRASITDPDGNIIEAIYLKSWWSQIIHFPIPITGQMVIGVIYLQILLLIGFSISVAIGLILEVLLIFVVANLVYTRLNSRVMFSKLEDSGLLDIQKRDRDSNSRTPYKRSR